MSEKFRSAEDAIEFYSRLFDRANADRPPELAGGAGAEKCSRCQGDRWRATWAPRRSCYEARCTSCDARWPGHPIVVVARSELDEDSEHTRALARIQALSLTIAGLPTWERRALVAYVLYPTGGRRYERVAEEFREAWPWSVHAEEIEAACQVAYESVRGSPSIGGSEGERTPRQRKRAGDWTFYRVRVLVHAGRDRLAASLRAAEMLEEETSL